MGQDGTAWDGTEKQSSRMVVSFWGPGHSHNPCLQPQPTATAAVVPHHLAPETALESRAATGLSARRGRGHGHLPSGPSRPDRPVRGWRSSWQSVGGFSRRTRARQQGSKRQRGRGSCSRRAIQATHLLAVVQALEVVLAQRKAIRGVVRRGHALFRSTPRHGERDDEGKEGSERASRGSRRLRDARRDD